MDPVESKTFLLVDDDPFAAEALRLLILKWYPSSVITSVRSLDRALEEVRARRPDIIVLDFMLARNSSGLALIPRLREEGLGTPVLVVSSRAEEEATVPVLKAGANGFISKSSAVDGQLLAHAIEKVIAGGTYLSEVVTNEATSGSSERSAGPLAVLSQREARVFVDLARGLSVKEIAHRLTLHEKTVRTYRMRAAQKLNLRTDAAIVRFALLHGLVE